MKEIILMAALVLSGCGGSSEPAKTSRIVGDWQFTYEGTICVERYSFNSDLTFTETSLSESLSGVYTFDDSGTGRAELGVVITQDNQLADCLGTSDDDTGVELTLYVEFLSADAMKWFDTETGGDSVILVKQ